jgi:hypothetical protein
MSRVSLPMLSLKSIPPSFLHPCTTSYTIGTLTSSMIHGIIDLVYLCVCHQDQNLTAMDVSNNNAMTNADPDGKRLAIPRSLRRGLVAVCSCAADQEKPKSEDPLVETLDLSPHASRLELSPAHPGRFRASC